MHRIAVVGGGTGETVVSNRLAEEPESEIDDGDVGVMPVLDDIKHVHEPVFLCVPFGITKPDDGVCDLRDLVNEQVDTVTNRVRRIDTGEKYFYCQDGDEELGYNTLVLVTGTKLDPDAIPGFRKGARHFYNVNGAERLRDALTESEDSRLVLSAVGAFHMYPAASLEFTFIVDGWFRSRELREDTDLVYAYLMRRSHEKPEVARWADPILAARGVRVETDFVVDAVGPDEWVVLAENGAGVDHDPLVDILPHRGDELITDSGPGGAGWVDVDQRTLHTTVTENVYTIDDTAVLSIPKAGSVAHFQAFAVAGCIVAEVRGRTSMKRYDGKTVCFVETGLDEVSFVPSDYETPTTMRQPLKPAHWTKYVHDESY